MQKSQNPKIQTPNINFVEFGIWILDFGCGGTSPDRPGRTGRRRRGNRPAPAGEPLGRGARRHSFIEKVRTPSGKPGWGQKKKLVRRERSGGQGREGMKPRKHQTERTEIKRLPGWKQRDGREGRSGMQGRRDGKEETDGKEAK